MRTVLVVGLCLVSAQVARAEEPDIVDDDRSALRIEAIDVVGNQRTTTEVILRRLSFGVGERIDDERVETSRLRLLATGYFKSVEFGLRRGSRRGLVVLVIELQERNTIIIDSLYLGFSEVAPFYGGLGVHETNFLGRGVATGAGFVIGADRRAAEFNVFVPDLSDTRLQLSASGIYVNAQEGLGTSALATLPLEYSRIGGTLGVGLGVGLAQRVLLDFRLETIEAEPLPNLDPIVLRGAPSIQFDESILSSLSLIYELDTRDDAFVPTRGARVQLAVEMGTKLIGSSYEFSKYTAEGQVAFETFSSQSMTLRAFGGVIQGQTPFFNQFFLSDFAYFAFGHDSLPRAIGVNFSESNDYDDLVVSAGADYNVLLQAGGDFLFRTYAYGAVDVSATASLDEVQEDQTGRGIGDRFPLSFDIGVRLDTLIGNFNVSLSYVLDLML